MPRRAPRMPANPVIIPNTDVVVSSISKADNMKLVLLPEEDNIFKSWFPMSPYARDAMSDTTP
eukprot:scaffold460548_cov28-Prasinocladus_malaysianus.AAC.1